MGRMGVDRSPSHREHHVFELDWAGHQQEDGRVPKMRVDTEANFPCGNQPKATYSGCCVLSCRHM